MYKFVLCLVFVSLGKIAAADTYIYESGHADLAAKQTLGDYRLSWHFDEETAVRQLSGGYVADPELLETTPDNVFVAVTDDLKVTYASTPANLALSGLNVGQADQMWILPQSFREGAPFVGFSGEELGGAGVITFRLLAADVPIGAYFSLWSSNRTSTTYRMTTFDGISGSDQIAIGSLSHAHFNLGFTEAGIYSITFDAIGTHNGTSFATAPSTFRFSVGDGVAVPEPSTCVIGIATALVVTIRSRRRRLCKC
jgi:surface-anchored protein